jgi:hypothetical protein
MLTRVNYFDKQFLKVEEFQAEQQYHIDARHRLTKAFLQWGVVDQPPVAGVKVTNLEVTKASDTEVKVAPGLAIDASGQEIVLGKDTLLQVPKNAAPGTTLYVKATYQDKFTGAHEWSGDPEKATRVTEGCVIELSGAAPPDGGLTSGEEKIATGVPLASFELDEQGRVPGKAGDILAGKARRYAGVRRLAPGAKAEDGLVVQGKLRATSDLEVDGNVGVGVDTPDNRECWNRVLEVRGAGNARITVRSMAGDAAIDGRFQVHEGEYWGAKQSLVIGTRTNHDVSFVTGSQVRMTVASSGVTVQGKLSSPMWNATQLFDGEAGPLPIGKELATSGGLLLIFANGSAYRNSGGTIGMRLLIDRSETAVTTLAVNGEMTRKYHAFPQLTVVRKVGRGTHLFQLYPYDAGTETNDIFTKFSLVVLELPF